MVNTDGLSRPSASPKISAEARHTELAESLTGPGSDSKGMDFRLVRGGNPSGCPPCALPPGGCRGASSSSLDPANANRKGLDMASRKTYPLWKPVAIAAGVTLTGIEVWGAVEYLLKQEGHVSYLVLGGGIVTAVAALLPPLAERCWQAGRKTLALLLWAALLPALALVLTAAIERSGGARDGAQSGRQVIAQRIELARSAEAEAKTRLKTAEAAVLAETARKDKPGCGLACKSLKVEVEEARKELKLARDAVAAAGVVPKDSQATRIAAILPVSEEAVALYQPIILPISISALGLLLIAVGAHSSKRRKAQKKRRGKRKKGRRPTPPKPSPAKVVPFRRRA